MIRKIAKPWTEVQLGFAFLPEEEKEPAVHRRRSTTPSEPKTQPVLPPDLNEALMQARTLLLDASLDEVSSQLLPLLEFCEATLTRALDVVALRETFPLFSAEEHRSLRGIGQAQWLLTEKLARRGNTSSERRPGKKRTTSDERSG